MKALIAGGGVGGLAAAIALRKRGHEAIVLEKAQRYARVGADVNLTPNAVRALDGLGVGAALRETAARPTFRISRDWDTGRETSRLPMGDEAERRYGAPQLTIHRADLLAALERQLPEGVVHHGACVESVSVDTDKPIARLTSGETLEADVLIGADGIHSLVRLALFGPEEPEFTGVVAYRAVVPCDRLAGLPNLDAFTKWWGPDPATQIVAFPLTRGEEIFVFATVPADDWRHESWTMPGEVAEFRDRYRGFYGEARALIDACDGVMKSALYVRDPLPVWGRGAVTLLGDACHPMMPFMAQGACQAIEDAVVLARALSEIDGSIRMRLRAYEEARKPRTAAIQIGSRGNDWLRTGGNADQVYGYDAWGIVLGG